MNPLHRIPESFGCHIGDYADFVTQGPTSGGKLWNELNIVYMMFVRTGNGMRRVLGPSSEDRGHR